MLGGSPRFNTPGHPQSTGLEERFNQSYKQMIKCVIAEHPRQWHKVIPFVVWALREVPNATTGISAWQMVYGNIPQGPLTLLKEV